MPLDAIRRPIVVAGDITIDHLTWTEHEARAATNPESVVPNWQQHMHTGSVLRPGGALLLAQMLRCAIPGHAVISYDIRDLEALPPNQALHSYVELQRGSDDAFSVARLRGFGRGTATPRDWTDSTQNPWLLVLDDSGNGFRKHRRGWLPLLQNAAPAWVILKMSRPLARNEPGELWNEVRPRDRGHPRTDVMTKEIDSDRLIVIVNADDLRHHGVQLTSGLSWERLAQDFVRNIGSVGKLSTLVNCQNLIVRFGCEGLIHYRGLQERPELYFEQSCIEDDLRPPSKDEQLEDGSRPPPRSERMIGVTAAFTAGLAAALASSAPGIAASSPGPHGAAASDVIEAPIRRGMEASQALMKQGFRATEPRGEPDYPFARVFGVARSKTLHKLAIPHADISGERGFSWRILDTRGSAPELARRVAVFGADKALPGVPTLEIGKLVTADRREIEAFRAIKNLLEEYLASRDTMPKPLSIAVFGPPGSGKSFGVTEIIAAITGGKQEPLEFNLSQFRTVEDLQQAFDLVRDRSLARQVPFVFFDEFDVAFEGRSGGWFKHFLAPMQDGRFRQVGALHPLGRAVFVFAGGTASSYKDFIKPLSSSSNGEKERFAAVKGPDFVSRLRGHIDILGPSRLDPGDDTFAIRRAILLRSGLQRRAGQLFSDNGKLAIDDGVLHAFLTIPDLHHGARSVQAILEMSKLGSETRFTRSLLPPPAQLNLHVDAGRFLDLVNGETLPPDIREHLGRRMHEAYCSFQRDHAGQDEDKHRELDEDPAMQPWDLLHGDYRDSNRAQADDVSRKLRRLGYYMAKQDARIARDPIRTFCNKDIEVLAELEHERWVEERLRAGWRPGERSWRDRKSPYLAPWCDLEGVRATNQTFEIKEIDRNAVRAIPDLLYEVGYGIYLLPPIDDEDESKLLGLAPPH